jgi:hypothetical protein
LCTPVNAFDEFGRRHPVGQRIRSYYGVSQTDKAQIDRIARDEFGDTPLDVIIDDASHLYGNTRRTFEMAFPYLRPGGTYVIEDWGWAHWPGRQYFAGISYVPSVLPSSTTTSRAGPYADAEIASRGVLGDHSQLW